MKKNNKNFAFYRKGKYLSNGVYEYQCLNCNDSIVVSSDCFDPNYCFNCGIEYKGRTINYRTYYINFEEEIKTREWQIQEACLWEHNLDKNSEGLEWFNRYTPKNSTAIEAYNELKALKKLKEDIEKVEKNMSEPMFKRFKKIHRIIRVDYYCYRSSIKINARKFYKKTGKFFDENRKDISIY